LRYTGPVFTTIPESIPGPGLPTASNYHVFPQFADGKFSDGTYYRTTRIYLNSGSKATDCLTKLYGASTDGKNTFTANNFSPGNFVVTPTNGTQTFQQGYATLQCSSSPVDAQELYSYYAPNGTKLSEATVFSSPPARSVQILVDSREGARMGLAIAKAVVEAHSGTIAVTSQVGHGSVFSFTLPINSPH